MTPSKRLEDILHAAIAAAGPDKAIRNKMQLSGDTLTIDGRPYDLSQYDGIVLLGAGKASAAMAKVAEDILGDRIKRGLVVTKYDHREDLKYTEIMEAAHPVPDAAGVEASARLIELAQSLGKRDLALVLISGGASALTPAPRSPVTLEQKQEATRQLLECGATIHEINAIRKHLSRFKGGLLADTLHPATAVSLIISDVVGDDLDVIASGPTAPDASTCSDCIDILSRYELMESMPSPVMEMLKCSTSETLKPNAPCFGGVQNVICAGNRQALLAAADHATQQGYTPLILTSRMEGEAREVAKMLASVAREIAHDNAPVQAPACILAGGEPTVTIRGKGKGGRNQELALAAAMALEDLPEAPRIVLGSIGTDGTDGPTDAAGAILAPGTLKQARDLGHNPHYHLTENDAYTMLGDVNALAMTGPTGTNVMDVVGVLIDK